MRGRATHVFMAILVRVGGVVVLYISRLCASELRLLHATYGIDIATCTLALIFVLTLCAGGAMLLLGPDLFDRVDPTDGLGRRR